MKVQKGKKDGYSPRSKVYTGLLALATFVALLTLASPALAKSGFSISLHFSDGYYYGSSIYYGRHSYGYSPYIYRHYAVPYGYYYGHNQGHHYGHLKHKKHHKFGGHSRKHKLRPFGHHRQKHFRGW